MRQSTRNGPRAGKMPPFKASRPTRIEVVFVAAQACAVRIAREFTPWNSAGRPSRAGRPSGGAGVRARECQPRVAQAASPWGEWERPTLRVGAKAARHNTQAHQPRKGNRRRGRVPALPRWRLFTPWNRSAKPNKGWSTAARVQARHVFAPPENPHHLPVRAGLDRPARGFPAVALLDHQAPRDERSWPPEFGLRRQCAGDGIRRAPSARGTDTARCGADSPCGRRTHRLTIR